MADELPEPNACSSCDGPKVGHGYRWDPVRSWHRWVQPDNTTRLARMRARREARTRVHAEARSHV